MTSLVLPDGPWWDWEVMSWSGDVLVLAAGMDLTYHHLIEVIFNDVDFVASPASFHDPTFRGPTNEERRLVHAHVGDSVPLVVAFDHDLHDSNGSPMTGLIGAGSVQVVEGRVFRYYRSELLPGERLASWVHVP